MTISERRQKTAGDVIEIETSRDADRSEPDKKTVFYGVEDVPSIPLMLLFAFQQTVMTISGTMSMAFILTSLLCAGDRPEVTARILSVTMFMCGVATIMQCVFGVRLGIIQGGSHVFVAPILAMMALDHMACPETTGEDVDSDAWMIRMREVQGNLMMASVTQLVLGLTGAMGFLLRFIGPLTIAPTVALIGLAFIDVVVGFGEKHWGLCFISMTLILTFSLYLESVPLPLPSWSKSRGWHTVSFPMFQLFPIILSIAVSWILCHILTVVDVLPSSNNTTGYYARTDVRLDVLERSPWLYWPYPFQFGWPTVSGAGYVGMLAATLASIIESIGDYFAAARISRVPPPPEHAINRGIAMEGLASIISGMVGAGHGTTSYSGNIGAIGITKVASRSVFITAGIMLVLCGVFGKFGAFLSMIPDPIIGGSLIVLFGLAGAVGLSVLKFVDLDSMRNLTILGVSLLLGLMIPTYINDPENANIIDTGSKELDQAITVLLGTAMFVGGVTGFILDNTVPGTDEERGIASWRKVLVNPTGNSSSVKEQGKFSMYDIPLVAGCFRRINFCSYVPVSPSFQSKRIAQLCQCCRRRTDENVSPSEVYDSPVSETDEIDVPRIVYNGERI